MSNTAQVSARRRIEALLDDSSFVEIGALVTSRSTDFNLVDNAAASDGVITGYGVINGSLVYVYSQDATILGGSVGEMHAKKITNLYDLALKMGAPVIGLIDCAGLRLQESTDALNGFGQIYLKQVEASGVIPQITAIFGSCGGGMAVVPTLTDFTFMEEKSARLFVNSPNALAGSSKEKLDTATAAFQSKEAGIVDGIGDEDYVLGQIRDLVTILPGNNEDGNYTACEDDLNRVSETIANAAGDTSIALADIADDNVFIQVKKDYAPDMVAGFMKLNGITVGAVANRSVVYDADMNETVLDGVLTPEGCEKAADFVNFCDAFGIPVLSLTNVKGYKATVCAEKRMAKAAARLTYAFANATVPKVNVIVGEAYGSAYVAMNSKAIGADVTYAWTDASIGMMDATLAAKIMYADKPELISEKAAEYGELQNSALAAAKRGYVDAIIEPALTRKYVIGAFEMLFTKKEDRPAKKHGTV